MTDIIPYLTPLIENNYFNVVSAVVLLASAIAAVTPTPKEGSLWAKVYKVIDFLALNIGKAKDKGPVK
jgi:hypothetical protein